MTFKNKIRGCDAFGAPITLKLNSEDSFKTFGGGLVSILLRLLTLIYFTMKLLAVFTYKDPTINSYKIQKSRKDGDIFNAVDFSLEFYFGFYGQIGYVPLDSRIGKFEVINYTYGEFESNVNEINVSFIEAEVE